MTRHRRHRQSTLQEPLIPEVCLTGNKVLWRPLSFLLTTATHQNSPNQQRAATTTLCSPQHRRRKHHRHATSSNRGQSSAPRSQHSHNRHRHSSRPDQTGGQPDRRQLWQYNDQLRRHAIQRQGNSDLLLIRPNISSPYFPCPAHPHTYTHAKKN